MDILDDMGVSKLSANVLTTPLNIMQYWPVKTIIASKFSSSAHS